MTVKELVKEFDEAIALRQRSRGRRIVRRLHRTLIRRQDCVHDDDEADPTHELVADAWARWKTSTQEPRN